MKKYQYAVFIESDTNDTERDRLFYECGYHYEWFNNLKRAKTYAKECKNKIKALMKQGKVKFNKNSVVSIDIERYDDWEDESTIDYDTRELVFSYALQGRY